MKRFIEKIVENILRLSGATTTIIILLMVVFLFKEGFGLFSNPVVEKGHVLCVNASNRIGYLNSKEIKLIFDGEIKNWNKLGGENLAIEVFRFNDIFSRYSEAEFGNDYEKLPEKLGEVISSTPGIIAFIPLQYMPSSMPQVKRLQDEKIDGADFFGGKEWIPTATPAPQFGVLPLVLGTLLVSLIAILIALPLGLGVAVYISELANDRIRKILKPAVELLAGIPSVVYGFFGLVVLVPLVQKILDLPVGETAFTGSLVLAIMALPTIITVAEDAMRSTPSAMREASLALGATHWQTIYKVIIPYASSGISAAVILGIGRAVGETMAVLMVTGNAAVIPTSLFAPIRTIPAAIAAELGEAPAGGAHYQALFMLGCILFMITLVMSIASELISKRQPGKGV
jgi:phosphate transport system permease protein